MARIRANNASGGGGGALYAEGTVNISTSARTSVETIDVATGVKFKPKTVITKCTGGTYYSSCFWDEDNMLQTPSGKKMWVANGNTSVQYQNMQTDNQRGEIYNIDDYGFTISTCTAAYGNKVTYKAWG